MNKKKDVKEDPLNFFTLTMYHIFSGNGRQ